MNKSIERPPGFWTVVTVKMLLIFGIVFLVASASLLFLPNKEIAVPFMFFSGIFILFIIIVTSFLIVRGFRNTYSFMYGIAFVLSINALILLSINFMVEDIPNPSIIPLLIGILVLALALYLIRSPSYQTYCLFRARYRERFSELRKAYEERAGAYQAVIEKYEVKSLASKKKDKSRH